MWTTAGEHECCVLVRSPMPVHLEFTLDYLIRRTGSSVAPAGRRLDDFERTIARLARSWRPDRPIAPARELRMADETCDALMAWVEGSDTSAPAPDPTIERLGVYASGALVAGVEGGDTGPPAPDPPMGPPGVSAGGPVPDASVREGGVRPRRDAGARPNCRRRPPVARRRTGCPGPLRS